MDNKTKALFAVFENLIVEGGELPITLETLPDITLSNDDFLLVQDSDNKVMGKTTVGHMKQALSTRFESEQEDGDHIVLETNAQGEAYGRMPWRIVE